MSRLSPVVSAVLMIALAAPWAAAGGKVYQTPQEAFDALLAASRKEDWKGVCATLTDDSVSKMTAGMVFMGVFMKGFMEAFAEKDKEGKLKGALKAINDVFEKHGLTRAKLDKLDLKGLMNPFDKKKEPKDMDKALAKVAGAVKDHPAFLVDFLNALKKMPGKQGAPLGVPQGQVELKDLKIDGNTAKATIVAMKNGKEKRDPIGFKKVGGGWKVEIDMKMGGPPGPGDGPPPPRRNLRLEGRRTLEARPAAAALLSRP